MLDTERDLKQAEEAIELMSSATSLADLKSAWETFLFRIERAWERTQRRVEAKPDKASQSWLSVNNKLRRSDPLLQYLKQARNAETHAIASTVEANKIISIADKYGRPFSINKLEITVEGRMLVANIDSYDIGIDWKGKIEPSDPKLQRFKCRGNWYEPPQRHLGNKIKDVHPVAIAALGLNFYKGAFDAFYSFGDSKII